MSEQNFRKLPSNGGTPRDVAFTVNQLVDGKMNATGEFTLAEGVTSTTITDYRVGENSVILMMPLTGNASAEYVHGNFYISDRSKFSFTIQHQSKNQSDLHFMYVVIG